MKGFLGFCLVVLVVYTIYYDLQFGTIPQITRSANAATHHVAQHKMPFQSVKVHPGDTVLSVVEHLNGNESVGIKKIIRDFEKLNPGASANQIQIGTTYRFPIYKK